jgi:UDP-glucose/GDP-mannose dehydrogenase family, central domain
MSPRLPGPTSWGITEVMGSDPRIGREFLGAGLGFGGYCLPKDLSALERLSARFGYDFGLLREVDRINREAVEAAASKIEASGTWRTSAWPYWVWRSTRDRRRAGRSSLGAGAATDRSRSHRRGL